MRSKFSEWGIPLAVAAYCLVWAPVALIFAVVVVVAAPQQAFSPISWIVFVFTNPLLLALVAALATRRLRKNSDA